MSVVGGDPEILPVTTRKTKTEILQNSYNQVYCLKLSNKIPLSQNIINFGQYQFKHCG